MTDDPELEQAPDYDPAALRLRTRTRLGGVAIALGTLLPYEGVGGAPQFLWDLVGELGLAGLIAYLAPALAGLAILVGSFVIERPAHLALHVLAVLVAFAIVVALGADATAWDVMPLPGSVGDRPMIPIAALALTAAGAGLTFAEETRRLGRGLLVGAVVIALSFYAWPGRGEAPLSTVFRVLGELDALPDIRFQVGMIIVAVLVLWPLLVSLVGLLHLRIPAPDDQPVLSIVARYGLGVLLLMFVFRGLPQSGQSGSTFHALGAIVFLTGLITVMASAIEVAAPALWAGPKQFKRAGLIAGVVVFMVGSTQWGLARPPSKGVEWLLVPSTASSDALFEEQLPRWNRARLRWDRQARSNSGAEALLAVKREARALVDAARAVHPGLGEAFAVLTKASRDLGLAGRKWYRLIGHVNTAIRKAGLPYYLDPTVITFGGETVRRHFRMRIYRVVKVRRFDVDGRAFATLHVDRLDGDSRGSPLLGFSRDLQRFAIVLRPEIREFQQELADGAASDPPSCVGGADVGGLFGAVVGGVSERICGDLLVEMVKTLGDGLDEAAAAVVDRHELQHQIDGPAAPMAGLVSTRMRGRSQPVRERINRELSAFLAQMTAPDAPPHLGVVHLARLAIGSKGRRVYPATALLALEALTGHPTLEDGEPDNDGVAQALSALKSMAPDALRARAAEAWAEQFGGALPPIAVREIAGEG